MEKRAHVPLNAWFGARFVLGRKLLHADLEPQRIRSARNPRPGEEHQRPPARGKPGQKRRAFVVDIVKPPEHDGAVALGELRLGKPVLEHPSVKGDAAACKRLHLLAHESLLVGIEILAHGIAHKRSILVNHKGHVRPPSARHFLQQGATGGKSLRDVRGDAIRLVPAACHVQVPPPLPIRIHLASQFAIYRRPHGVVDGGRAPHGKHLGLPSCHGAICPKVEFGKKQLAVLAERVERQEVSARYRWHAASVAGLGAENVNGVRLKERGNVIRAAERPAECAHAIAHRYDVLAKQPLQMAREFFLRMEGPLLEERSVVCRRLVRSRNEIVVLAVVVVENGRCRGFKRHIIISPGPAKRSLGFILRRQPAAKRSDGGFGVVEVNRSELGVVIARDVNAHEHARKPGALQLGDQFRQAPFCGLAPD